MSTIIPDTSLYTDLPNKLRALTLIFESLDEKCREVLINGTWHIGGTDTYAVVISMGKYPSNPEYRIKPKPRGLWVSFNRNGTIYESSTSPVMQHPGTTVVRFVE